MPIVCDLGFHKWVSWKVASVMSSNYETEYRVCERCGKLQTKYAHMEYLWMESFSDEGFIEDYKQIARLVKQKQQNLRDQEKARLKKRSERKWKHGEVHI